MKTTSLIIAILISCTVLSQEKFTVKAKSFDQATNNLVVTKGEIIDTLKVIQFYTEKEVKMMNPSTYNRFVEDSEGGEYRLKKILRLRPINYDRFKKENYLAEYFYNAKGEHLIIMQRVANYLSIK